MYLRTLSYRIESSRVIAPFEKRERHQTRILVKIVISPIDWLFWSLIQLYNPSRLYNALSYNSGRSLSPCFTLRISSAKYKPKGCHLPTFSSNVRSSVSASARAARED